MPANSHTFPHTLLTIMNNSSRKHFIPIRSTSKTSEKLSNTPNRTGCRTSLKSIKTSGRFSATAPRTLSDSWTGRECTSEAGIWPIFRRGSKKSLQERWWRCTGRENLNGMRILKISSLAVFSQIAYMWWASPKVMRSSSTPTLSSHVPMSSLTRIRKIPSK